MCGIAGYVTTIPDGAALSHRGPDDSGLRPALEKAGHRYRTRSGAETILHAYERHGPACLSHFYYSWDGRRFVFASEIKALLEHPEISAALDSSLLPEYLAFGYRRSEGLLAGARAGASP